MAATQEIATSAANAASQTQQVTANIAEVNAAASDTDNVAGSLGASANALNDEIESASELFQRFLIEVNSFEKIVRGEIDTSAGERQVAGNEETQADDSVPPADESAPLVDVAAPPADEEKAA